MQDSFEPGHLAQGGALGRPRKDLVCVICGNEFSNFSPNAKACVRCKPEFNRRRNKAKYKKTVDKYKNTIVGKDI